MSAREERRLAWLVGALALGVVGLLLVRPGLVQWHARWYMPEHTTMEMFCVVVALLTVSTGWHSVDGRLPLRVALLAPSALAVGLFDFGHVIWVADMPGFDLWSGPGGPSYSLEFRMFARSTGALALLAAALAPAGRSVDQRWPRYGVALALAFTLAVAWALLALPGQLPATWDGASGITRFKIQWEWAILLVNALAAGLLARSARAHGSRMDAWLAATAAILALSGVYFTAYRSADDAFNMIGHLYKMCAYLCLYRAIYAEVVQAPYIRLRASERSLADSETKFRSLMECAPDAILLAARDGRIAMLNARAQELFGLARGSAEGLPVDLLVPPGADSDEVVCRHAGRGDFPAEVRRAATPAGQQIAIVRDISERRRLERALLEQLTCDALTGLPNRRRILETLGEAIAAAREEGRRLAVLVLDLDEFRKINNSYGYAGGDDVLRECVARLGRLLPQGHTLARQGGNEFIIVQRDADQQPSEELAAALLAALSTPFMVNAQPVFVSASIGIALLPEEPCAPHVLLEMAQVAMANARAAGRGEWRFHTAAMAEAIRVRVDLEALLRSVLVRDELLLQFQPRVRATDGAIVGVEALVRWRHPLLGLVSPGAFIPLAEETGMIEEIDMWVLGQACAAAAVWRARGLPGVRISVNLSARQFQQGGLAQRVRAALEASGLPPACLELEITEGTVMRDTEVAVEVLRSLKDLGVALSIDDFGTGYSSLSYLKRFPIDVLKIDRSFVQDVTTDANDAAIARAIIGLAHSLNLEAVAEGVETAEQAAFLKANGCDEVQGYFFSRPLWPEAFEALLEREVCQPTT